MASIAVLPILIGLAVDYAVQFQARSQEGSGDVVEATIAAAPTIATAALATAAGFLALLLSPVPMVRGFGELLIVGIAIALACALSAGTAAMVLAAGAGGRLTGSGLPRRGAAARRVRVPGVLAASARGAGRSWARRRVASRSDRIARRCRRLACGRRGGAPARAGAGGRAARGRAWGGWPTRRPRSSPT